MGGKPWQWEKFDRRSNGIQTQEAIAHVLIKVTAPSLSIAEETAKGSVSWKDANAANLCGLVSSRNTLGTMLKWRRTKLTGALMLDFLSDLLSDAVIIIVVVLFSLAAFFIATYISSWSEYLFNQRPAASAARSCRRWVAIVKDAH